MSNKRRILKKMALIGLIVAALSATVLFSSLALQQKYRANRRVELAEKRDALITKYRTYLRETAQKVTRLPVDPAIVGQAQAHYFEEYPQARLNLWAMDNRGEFLFGVPGEGFSRLNRAYDTYRQVIEKEGHFTDRQDFLRRLIQNHKDLDFTLYDAMLSGQNPQQTLRRPVQLWRDYDREGLTFSTPLLNEQGQMLGNMYLKVSGLNDSYDYYNEYEAPLGISSIFLVISLLFLWFLLPTWVYLDALARGVKSPARWSILTLVSLIFGLTVYLILRPEEGGEIVCQGCGRVTRGGRYCPYCGAANASEFCPTCGYPTSPEWKFCPNCQAANGSDSPEGAVQVAPSKEEATLAQREPAGS